MGGLSVGLSEAWARVLASEKPLLTEENLNAFIRNNENLLPNDYEEARANLGVFLEKYFTLTARQKDYFNKYYRRDKSKWNDFFNKIESGVKTKTRVKNPPRIKTYPRARVAARPGGTTQSGGTTYCVGNKEKGCCVGTSEEGAVKITWGGLVSLNVQLYNK